MKKGDLKKQEFIRTAESLFCRNGYEATSIQDILDELNTSKGSFYHHFVSKEALLEEICRQRAQGITCRTEELMHSSDVSPILKLNRLFSEMIPFSGEKLSFLLMILPVFILPEGSSLKLFYGKELTDLYRSPVAAVLHEGTKTGVFSCTDVDFFTETSLQLVNSLWLKICETIVLNESACMSTDSSELLTVISLYRLALERLLCAPFGTIELIRLPEIKTLTEQIHRHWKQK